MRRRALMRLLHVVLLSISLSGCCSHEWAKVDLRVLATELTIIERDFGAVKRGKHDVGLLEEGQLDQLTKLTRNVERRIQSAQMIVHRLHEELP